MWARQVQYSRANGRVGVHPEAPWDLRQTGLALPAFSGIVRDEQRGLFVFASTAAAYKMFESAGSIASAAISPSGSGSATIVSSAWSDSIRMPRIAAGLGLSSFQVTPSSVLRHRPVTSAYMVLGALGSNAKKRTVPRRLNILQERPASWVM